MEQTIEYKIYLCSKKSKKNNKVPYNYFSHLFRTFDQKNNSITIYDINKNLHLTNYTQEQFNNENYLLLIATEKNKITGFCVAEIPNKEEDTGYIDFIETYPTYRNQGIASSLLKQTLTIFAEKRINKCNITCLDQTFNFWSARGAIIKQTNQIAKISEYRILQMQFKDLETLIDKSQKIYYKNKR